jgi:glycosyltransferase involved in cell wall biosynthesis
MNRSKKLVAIVTSYSGSLINFRGSLISSLLNSGVSVYVLAPDFSLQTRNSLLSLGAKPFIYPLNRVGLNPLSDLRSFLFLLRFFLRHRPSSVLTYFVKPNIWAIFAAFFAGVHARVSIVEGLGYSFTPSSSGSRSLAKIFTSLVILFLYSISFRMASSVLVLNSDDKRLLASSCVLSSCKLHLLGGIGVCLQSWPLSPPHVHPFTFTMVARLLREKGVFEFLAAAETVKNIYPDVVFNLLGSLDSNPGAISLSDISYWVDNSFVNYLGQVDVFPFLLVTSVFVLPSYREGLPVSTQEALALGRPILTTDVPGCRDTVCDGVNGFIVPPFDSISLAKAMIYFVENPDLVSKMGTSSRSLACSRFDRRRADASIYSHLRL